MYRVDEEDKRLERKKTKLLRERNIREMGRKELSKKVETRFKLSKQKISRLVLIGINLIVLSGLMYWRTEDAIRIHRQIDKVDEEIAQVELNRLMWDRAIERVLSSEEFIRRYCSEIHELEWYGRNPNYVIDSE